MASVVRFSPFILMSIQIPSHDRTSGYNFSFPRKYFSLFYNVVISEQQWSKYFEQYN